MPSKARRGGKGGTRGKKVPRRPSSFHPPQPQPEQQTEQQTEPVSVSVPQPEPELEPEGSRSDQPKVTSIELSTHLVQTAVAAIFYQILKTRHVFAEYPWRERFYFADDPNNSFDAFVDGPDVDRPRVPGQYIWYVPKRNQDEKVDKFMNVLESSAKEPIEKGYLKKLQLCFHKSDEYGLSECNLIESYCLTFEYTNGEASSQFSKRVRNAETQEVTASAVTQGRQMLIKMVDKILEDLSQCDKSGRMTANPLPGAYRLNILAEYNDSAPGDYQPLYFKPGDADTMELLNLCNSRADWVMATTHHKISAGVLLPSYTPPDRHQTPTYDTNSESSSTSLSVPRSRLVRAGSNQHSQQSQRRLRLPSIGDGTQREAVSLLNGTGTSRNPNDATHDTQQLLQHRLPSQQPKKAGPEPIQAPLYTQYIMDYMNSRLAEYTGDTDYDLDGSQGIGDKVDVKCECGSTDEVGRMIKCVDCRYSQHSDCYGYLDDVHPSHHLCYSCLSKKYPDDRQQLRKAEQLCVLRHALFFLRDSEGPLEDAELADLLGRDNIEGIEFTKKVTGVLENSGLIQSNGRLVEYVGNDEMLRRGYFQPEKHINNLFSLPDSSSANLLDLNRSGGASYRTPSSSHDAALHAKGSSRTPILDDGTTQGEPSPQSSTPAFVDDEAQNLRDVARRGLDLNPSESGSPPSKRFSETQSPPQSLKRRRFSRASPFSFY